MTDWLEEAKTAYQETMETLGSTAWSSQAVDTHNLALIALAEEQRKTNEYLGRIADTLDLQAAEDALADFTQYPRPDWPGHCGMEEEAEVG